MVSMKGSLGIVGPFGRHYRSTLLRRDLGCIIPPIVAAATSFKVSDNFYRQSTRVGYSVPIRVSGGGGRVCPDAGPGRDEPLHLSREATSPCRGDFGCEPGGPGRGGTEGFQERPDRILSH